MEHQNTSSTNLLDSLSANINPITNKLTNTFGLARQYAQERLGTAEEVTLLPETYCHLEKRVDNLAQAQASFLKVSRIFNDSTYDRPMPIISAPWEDMDDDDDDEHDGKKRPIITLLHALAHSAEQGSEALGVDDPLGAALFRTAETFNKMGDARVVMDRTIAARVNNNTHLASAIKEASRARRHVQSLRLALDALKHKYRTARPDRRDSVRMELQMAEEQYAEAVQNSFDRMQQIVTDSEPFQHLVDLVVAQAVYYKEAYELSTQLLPQLDEILVVQESLHRHRQ
ncbi:hypothetical protein BX666DRAFT_1890260 [Dichotomocladium elegans]|nr:hypothetical protein BX666DRAFT_1890260 [Dichotomocladium elegans]